MSLPFAWCAEENKRVTRATRARKGDRAVGAGHREGRRISGTHVGLKRSLEFPDRLLKTNGITIQIKLIKNGGGGTKVNKLIMLIVRVILCTMIKFQI